MKFSESCEFLQLSVCKGDFAFQWLETYETWSLEELKALFRSS